jgi:hypothetical protein
LSQNRHVEIDDEPNRLVQQLQIGEKLCFMYGKDSLNALQLEDYDILDDHIKAITTVEGHAFVDNRDGDLSLKPQLSEMAFHGKGILRKLIPTTQVLMPYVLPWQRQ